MALDQSVHSEAQRLWGKFRLKWAKRGEKLKLLRALYAIAKITEDAYTSQNIRSSWEHIGFEPGKPLNKKRLLVDRVKELFHASPSAATVQFQAAESEWLLPKPENWRKALDKAVVWCKLPSKCL